MNMRTRLSLFTTLIIVSLVAGVSISMIHFLNKLFWQDVRINQESVLNNFRKVCQDSVELGDAVLIVNYSQSLKETVPGLAYTIFARPDLDLVTSDLGSSPFPRLFPAVRELFPTLKDALILPEAVNPPVPRILTLLNGRRVEDWAGPVTVEMDISDPGVPGGKRKDAQFRGVARLGFYEDAVVSQVVKKTEEIQRVVWVVSGVALGLAILAALSMAARLTAPLDKLTAGAKALGEGNLDTQLTIKRSDEIGILAAEFNLMAKRLKELDQLKDEFVSSVSHELRSPLSAIAGYVELLTAKPIENMLPEKRTKALNIIQESTTRLTGFINDILDLAKIKSGRVDVRRTPFQLRPACEEILGLFAPLFDKKKIVPVLQVAGDLPPVWGDEEKIKQVFTNLVSNALKFTPDGGTITLMAETIPGALRVAVTDTGPGIPAEFSAQIFERFKQVPGLKPQGGGPKGTGLGLAIAKGVIEAHGGRIWVEGGPGQGGRFLFTLPLPPESETVPSVSQANIFH